MKTKLMAAVAVLAVITATGAARADNATDVQTLKAQAAAMKKQNQALEKRLNKLEKKQAAVVAQPAPASTDFVASVTKGPMDVLASDEPICLHGICVFGTLDAGLGYSSHGASTSSQFYAGDSIVQKMSNHAYTGIMPNGLSQSTLGIKGEQEFLPGFAGIFKASTGFNPQSGQLANAPGSQLANALTPQGSQTINGDGSRGGQAFNDELYAGISSKSYGQLTFGRQKTFANDMLGKFDPMGGSYDFSPIGFSGTPVAGAGMTDESRLDDTMKYKIAVGNIYAGAMYKFAEGTAGTAPANNNGYAGDLGAKFGGLELETTYAHYNQAMTYSGYNNSGVAALKGTVADLDGLDIGAKYTWNQFKFFAGYAHDTYVNPHDANVGAGADLGQGSYEVFSANVAAYQHTKVLQTEWAGMKYAYDPKTEITVAYYHEGQNTFGATSYSAGSCAVATTGIKTSGCAAGDLNAVSALVDYHFTKRFDVYGGFMYSVGSGGMVSGYLYNNTIAPSAGARLTF